MIFKKPWHQICIPGVLYHVTLLGHNLCPIFIFVLLCASLVHGPAWRLNKKYFKKTLLCPPSISPSGHGSTGPLTQTSTRFQEVGSGPPDWRETAPATALHPDADTRRHCHHFLIPPFLYCSFRIMRTIYSLEIMSHFNHHVLSWHIRFSFAALQSLLLFSLTTIAQWLLLFLKTKAERNQKEPLSLYHILHLLFSSPSTTQQSGSYNLSFHASFANLGCTYIVAYSTDHTVHTHTHKAALSTSCHIFCQSHNLSTITGLHNHSLKHIHSLNIIQV